MTNDKIQMTKEIKITNDKYQNRRFDLEDRTLKFAKDCIDLCRAVPKDSVNMELANQLVRASTSVGSNYREANDTLSKRDFYHRIGICRREAKESKYWLELCEYANPKLADKARYLTDESLQLIRIFASISMNK